jgi:hypothetical protein
MNVSIAVADWTRRQAGAALRVCQATGPGGHRLKEPSWRDSEGDTSKFEIAGKEGKNP